MGSSLLVLSFWMQHRLPETLELPAHTETAIQARDWVQALSSQLQNLAKHRRLLVQVMAWSAPAMWCTTCCTCLL